MTRRGPRPLTRRGQEGRLGEATHSGRLSGLASGQAGCSPGWPRDSRYGYSSVPNGAERMPGGEVENGSAKADGEVRVAQLRLAVTAEDYDHALRFYRDVLGMPEVGVFASPAGGRVTILDAGRATLEISDPLYAAYIDEVEVGRRGGGRSTRAGTADQDTVELVERPARSAGGSADHPLRRTRRFGLKAFRNGHQPERRTRARTPTLARVCFAPRTAARTGRGWAARSWTIT